MERPSAAASEHEQRVNEAIARYLEAAAAGRAPEEAAWLAAHPDLAVDLAAFLRDRHDFARLAAPLGPAAPPALSPADMPTLAPGEKPGPTTGTTIRYFGDYELLEELARGGMGVVWRARQVSVGRLVALKTILAGQLASAEDVQRFRNEATAAGRLDHPHVVPVYEVGECEGLHYFSMKLVEGRSLAAKSCLPLAGGHRATATLLAKVARAVDYAHRHGVLHRDLKPANILLDRDGEPHVTDFGLAKRLADAGQGLTQTGAIVGTPAYMAPEQARAEKSLSTAADVYGLGGVLYECLTGRAPFQGTTALDIVLQVVEREPPRPRSLAAEVPADLETICLKCLEKAPARRYSSAAALADDLERWLREEPIQARPVGQAERVVKWAKRRPAASALVGVCVLSVAALLGGLAVSNRLLAAKQRVTESALEREGEALRQQEKSHEQTRAALRGEEQAASFSRLALAHNEWHGNHVARAVELLDECPPHLQQWEWRYLKRLCRGERQSLAGHDDAVQALTYSPDGKLLATAGGEGTVRLWEVATGALRLTFRGHPKPPTCVVFHPTEGDVVSGSQSPFSPWALLASALTGESYEQPSPPSELLVWDPATGEVRRTIEVPSEVHAVALTGDGSRLFVSCADDRLRAIDWVSGEELWSEPWSGLGGALACRPDGRELAVAGGPKEGPWQVRLLDPNGGVLLHAFPAQPSAVTCLTYSRTGDRLAAASADRVVVWDTATRTVRFQQHVATGISSHAVAFSPDGRTLAVACLGQKVRWWDLETGAEKSPLRGHTDWVTGVAFSPGGEWLAASTGHPLFGAVRTSMGQSQPGEVKVWDATVEPEARLLRGHTKAVRALTVSPDGRHVATGGDDKTIRVWDTTTWRMVRTLQVAEPASALAFSPDGGQLLVAGEEARWWDWREGKMLRSLPTASTDVALLPARGLFAMAGRDGRVRLGDLATGEERFAVLGPASGGFHVAAGQGGAVLAVAHVGWTTVGGAGGTVHLPGSVRLIDPATGQTTARLTGIGGKIGAVAWSRGGRWLAVGDGDEVRLYHADGREAGVLRGRAGDVQGLAFTPDEARLAATSERAVKLWDLESGREALTLVGGARAPAFTPDGHHLLAVSGNDVRVWDATPLAPPPPPTPTAAPVTEPAAPAPVDARPPRARECQEKGVEYLEMGQPALALLWFAAGLRADADDATGRADVQRRRLTLLLQQLPKLGETTATPRELPAVAKPVPGLGHVVVSPDGSRMAVWLYNVEPTAAERTAARKAGRPLYNLYALQVFETRTGRAIGPLWRTEERIFERGLEFTADGHHLAVLTVAREDRPPSYRLRLRVVETGAEVGPVIEHRDTSKRMLALDVSPDGRWLVLHQGPYDSAHTALAWEAATGRPLRLDAAFNEIHFSPDGRRLLTTWNHRAASRWNTVTAVWDARTLRAIGPPLPCGRPDAVAFSRDGAVVAVGVDGAVHTYTVADGKPRGPAISVGSRILLDLHPEGHTIAVARNRDLFARSDEAHEISLQLWDVASGRPRSPRRPLPVACTRLRFAADGRLLFTASNASWQSHVQAWDTLTAVPLGLPVLGHAGTDTLSLFPSADGATLATFVPHDGSYGSDDKMVKDRLFAWDLRPTALSVDALEQLAQLHSGHRLDASGAEAVLSLDEYRTLWREARAGHPEWFGKAAPEEPDGLPKRSTGRRPLAARRSWNADYAAVLRRHPAAAVARLGAIAEGLAEVDGDARLAAFEELHRHGPPAEPTIALFAEGLRDPDAKVRAAAAEYLGRRGVEMKSAVPDLRRALDDWHEPARRAATWALGRIGPAARGAIPDLVRAVQEDEHYVRGEAARALVRIDPRDTTAVPALVAHLDEYGDTRRHIVRALVELGRQAPEAVVPAVVAELGRKPVRWSSDYRRRGTAASALAQLGPQAGAALPIVRGWLTQPELRGQGRVALAEALWRIGDEADTAVVHLRRVLRDGSDDHRDDELPSALAGAAEVLGRIGPGAKAALPDLEKLLASTEPRGRLAAAVALNRVDPRVTRTLPVLTALLAESDRDVQCGAIAELERMGPEAKTAAPALRAAAKREEEQFTRPGIRWIHTEERDEEDRKGEWRMRVRRAVAAALGRIEGPEAPR